ncbi:MAG: NADH-quinone oxidoreductase subunit M, partial [Planctomycetia bacterium]|nr:NADH-quinone oxidoreductase subunit M [Planctomycetia bacterium]
MKDEVLLSLIIFLPTLGALFLGLFNQKSEGTMRTFGNAVTFATFVLTLFAWYKFDHTAIKPDHPMEMYVKIPWIATWNVHYQLGLDGISMQLVVLTSFISWLAMLASTSVTKQVRGYLVLYLILETGMLGVFMALDFFLFYVFWEVMLLPMYFLIGIWGGP